MIMIKPLGLDIRNYCKEYLEYHPEDGLLKWIKSPGPRAVVGRSAGSLNISGYITLHINGERFQAHRLIWLMYYGKDPKMLIDHINGIKTDNRIENLREVSNGENLLNQRIHREGRLPYTAKCRGRWSSRVNGKHLGSFASEIEAHKASLKYLSEL